MVPVDVQLFVGICEPAVQLSEALSRVDVSVAVVINLVIIICPFDNDNTVSIACLVVICLVVIELIAIVPLIKIKTQHDDWRH